MKWFILHIYQINQMAADECARVKHGGKQAAQTWVRGRSIFFCIVFLFSLHDFFFQYPAPSLLWISYLYVQSPLLRSSLLLCSFALILSPPICPWVSIFWQLSNYLTRADRPELLDACVCKYSMRLCVFVPLALCRESLMLYWWELDFYASSISFISAEKCI